jgi:hypothetical protein
MKQYRALVIEQGAWKGKIIGNTKNGIYKGMSKDEFEAALKKATALTFKIEEIK